MKISITLSILFALLLASPAITFADNNFESVTTALDLEVSKCESSPSGEICDSASSIGTNQAIILSDCPPAGGGVVFCSGTWDKVIWRDGYPFKAKVMVTKTTSSTGWSQYSLKANVGPLWPFKVRDAKISVWMAGSTMTDTVILNGSPFSVSPNNGSSPYYIPTLTIAPPMPLK